MKVICENSDKCDNDVCNHIIPHDIMNNGITNCTEYQTCLWNKPYTERKCNPVLSYKDEMDKIFEL